MLINGGPINSAALNDESSRTPAGQEPQAEGERQPVFLLDIDGLIFPISSAQATMRMAGASFMQAVVPTVGQFASGIIAAVGSEMQLKSGYRYVDGSYSDMSIIASAPLQQISRATGPVSDTMTISGYGEQPLHDPGTHHLSDVQTRTVSAGGRRRVRSGINLDLRPGQTAVDSDGAEITAGVIQYFINSSSEAMEVHEDG